MIIVIQRYKSSHIDDLINDIHKKYDSKIKKIKKSIQGIELINGDIIKFTLESPNKIAGLRADVAIGPHAEYITCASKQDKRIWDFSDLDNYLQNL